MSVTIRSSQLSTEQKLQQLQSMLLQHQLDAYMVSAEDEHLNEYLPEPRQRVAYLTGFSGENAPVLVTREKLEIFVDGRFHIQVDMEVDPEFVVGHKLGLQGVPTLSKRMLQLAQNQPLKIGYDPFTWPQASLNQFKKQAQNASNLIEFIPLENNWVDVIWPDCPSMPQAPVFKVEKQYSGMDTAEKLALLKDVLKEKKVDYLFSSRLDEIAWLLNLRGRDIPYNPVFESDLLITPTQQLLFIRNEILHDAIQAELTTLGFDIKMPEEKVACVAQVLLGSKNTQTAWLDLNGTTAGIYQLFENAACNIYPATNPITELKAIKNPTEQHWMHQANQQASIALMEHFAWAEQAFNAGKKLTEVMLRDDVEKRYRERPNFYDLSFPSIPGLNANSAIIHYCHASDEAIAAEGSWYLLDSGAHYTGGTTDTTRTTVFGKPTLEQQQKFTAVLKSHIACALQVFPEGTTGSQLDAICRAPLWQQGLNFGHGTGHGVGAFLNVHEGPNRISSVCHVVFEAGMVTSIEPGYYLANWGGIRLENLYLVVEKKDMPANMGKPNLGFESLQLLPFEEKLILKSELTLAEISWLKQYYQQIITVLKPQLSQGAQQWLVQQVGWVIN